MKLTFENRHASRATFTLLELLVVIVVILILVGILLPVLSSVRAKGKMTSCRNNLGQLGISTAMYRGDYEDKMPGWLSNLTPEYGITPKLLVCPQDYSEGFDGGRPRREEDPANGDKHTAEDYGIEYISQYGEVFDSYTDTDDTDRNTAALNDIKMPRNKDITNCSYMYEFAGVTCGWTYWGSTTSGGKSVGNFLVELQDLGGPEDDPGWTWNQVKESQLRMGSWNALQNETKVAKKFQSNLFPSVRCFYHWGTMWGKKEYILNTSYEGSTFPSRAEWELGTYE